MTRTRRTGPVAHGPGSEISYRQATDQQQQSRRSDRLSQVDRPEGRAWEQLALDFDAPPPGDDVLAGRDQAERNADDWWLRTALQAVRAMARTGCEFQAFDLVDTYGVPEPDHPNRWGALLTRAARDGLIVAVGAAPSRRPSTAKSLTRTWRGAP